MRALEAGRGPLWSQAGAATAHAGRRSRQPSLLFPDIGPGVCGRTKPLLLLETETLRMARHRRWARRLRQEAELRSFPAPSASVSPSANQECRSSSLSGPPRVKEPKLQQAWKRLLLLGPCFAIGRAADSRQTRRSPGSRAPEEEALVAWALSPEGWGAALLLSPGPAPAAAQVWCA